MDNMAMRLRGLGRVGNVGMGDFLDTLNTYGSKASSLVNTGASIVNTVSNTGTTPKTIAPATTVISTPSYQPPVINPPAPTQGTGLSTGAKVAIGAGVLVVIGGIIFAVTAKKKKG